jgi:hypothetical protein
MSDVKLINSCDNCATGWKNFKHLTKIEKDLINENRYEATFKPGEMHCLWQPEWQRYM